MGLDTFLFCGATGRSADPEGSGTREAINETGHLNPYFSPTLSTHHMMQEPLKQGIEISQTLCSDGLFTRLIYGVIRISSDSSPIYLKV